MPAGVRALLEMIKFQHSVFALPFAVSAAVVAARGEFLLEKFLWILGAMISARSAAMAFNRIVDRHFDARNPRTADRELPRGVIPVSTAWIFTAVMSALFLLSAAMLNRTCLSLAPVALFVLLGYSFTKRFTWLCHFVLGLSLGMAPVGAWIAVRETIDSFPVLLGTAVLFWVAGFDMIYACLDVEFDRAEKLHSLPARFGIRPALAASAACHALTGAALGALWISGELGWIYALGLLPAAALLIYQHAIVRPDDLRRVNEAFFNANAVLSLTVMAAILGDLFLRLL